MEKQMNSKVAFALGGLAGNNSHGAGFLYAALHEIVEPIMISCTSGQIRWVYQYLLANNDSKKFLTAFEEELSQSRKTGEANTDLALLSMFGLEKVFRPAYDYWFFDAIRNAGDTLIETIKKIISKKGELLITDQILSLIPGRLLVPLFDETLLKEISTLFNQTAIGIVFNSYNPAQGLEHVYINQAARTLLHDPASPQKYNHDKKSAHRPYRVYRDIDSTAIRDALWLYQYGFYEDNRFVDGAYFRDIMLAELVSANLIFSVRPINHKWLGDLPKSYPTIEDLKTEVGLNGCYAAERDQISLINKLINKNLISSQARNYHPIELVELEIGVQRGYFEYALESRDVFDKSEKAACSKFNQLRGSNKLPPKLHP